MKPTNKLLPATADITINSKFRKDPIILSGIVTMADLESEFDKTQTFTIKIMLGKSRKKTGHKQRHKELHQSLDELLADFLRQNPKKLPSNTTILELMKWSHKQTVKPTKAK